jgi:arylsulfatase A-like enzyme
VSYPVGMLAAVLLACRRDDGPPPVTRPDPVGEPLLEFEGERPRNVLFLSFDTTRRDHLDPWATDGVVRTDFLAATFAQGVTLEDHVQCSNWTYASTSCTLRGRNMEETGFYPKLFEGAREPLPDGQPTLARRLADAGYDTALLSPNEWLSPVWNNAQGYTEVVDLASGDARSVLSRSLVELRERWESPSPWLVHVHFMDPHAAYVLHEGYTDEIDALPPYPGNLDEFGAHYRTVKRWPRLPPEQQAALALQLEARYTGELRYLDDRIAEWWSTVESEGYLDDTLVVFWNDHGEQFFEHGRQTHALDLHAEENDGFAVFWAKNLPAQRWDGPTHAIDLVPTVLDALGLPAGEDPELPGYVLGTAPASRPRFAASVARLGPLVSVIQDGQKLIFDLQDGELEQFDRNRDRVEARDVYDPADPTAAALWRLLETRVELLGPLAEEWDQRDPRHPPR